MKIDYCIRERKVDEEGKTQHVTQFAVSWDEDDLLEGCRWKLPLFTEHAECALRDFVEPPEGTRRVTGYYHVSIDGMKMFGKFVDEES